MSDLDLLLKELKKHSSILGVDLYIDDSIDKNRRLYVVVSENGTVGATGYCDDSELVYLFLDNKKVKYLFDEGFDFEDFYKIMGDKLFYFVSKEMFFERLFKK